MPLSRRYTPEWAPGESAVIGMDYSFVIPPGVGIASGGLTVLTNTATPAVSTDFTIGPAQVSGRAIYCPLSGGVAGHDYQLAWDVQDTAGNIYPRTALMLCAPTS